jgi:hypothetical protein
MEIASGSRLLGSPFLQEWVKSQIFARKAFTEVKDAFTDIWGKLQQLKREDKTQGMLVGHSRYIPVLVTLRSGDNKLSCEDMNELYIRTLDGKHFDLAAVDSASAHKEILDLYHRFPARLVVKKFAIVRFLCEYRDAASSIVLPSGAFAEVLDFDEENQVLLVNVTTELGTTTISVERVKLNIGEDVYAAEDGACSNNPRSAFRIQFPLRVAQFVTYGELYALTFPVIIMVTCDMYNRGEFMLGVSRCSDMRKVHLYGGMRRQVATLDDFIHSLQELVTPPTQVATWESFKNTLPSITYGSTAHEVKDDDAFAALDAYSATTDYI